MKRESKNRKIGVARLEKDTRRIRIYQPDIRKLRMGLNKVTYKWDIRKKMERDEWKKTDKNEEMNWKVLIKWLTNKIRKKGK